MRSSGAANANSSQRGEASATATAPPTKTRRAGSLGEAAKIVFHPLTYLSLPNVVYAAMGCLVWAAGLYPLNEVTVVIKDSRGAMPLSIGSFLQVHGSWILPVIIRNLLMTFCVYTMWHYFLYRPTSSARDDADGEKGKHTSEIAIRESLLRAGIGPVHKFNKEYPPINSWNRDRALTLSGSFLAGCLECTIVYLQASGVVPHYSEPLAGGKWLMTIAFLFVVAFWSDIHFYFAHRVLHPWFGWGARGSKGAAFVVDPGKWLYRHVHSYHHVAKNPGPWSGLAMHPLEHVIYFSRSLLLFVIPCHPIHFLFCNIRAQIGPAPGHHGYDKPLGSRFHYIHHKEVECNYGTRGTLDLLFGTYKE